MWKWPADCPHPRGGSTQYNLDTQDRTNKFLRLFWLLKADHQQSKKRFYSSTSEITADCLPPRSGPSAGLFPAEMYLGKTAITLSSNVQIWWSWTLWKDYSEGYTTHLNIWSKTQWIKIVFHSKSQPNLRRTPKSLSCFPKLININSNSFSFANVPTTPRDQHHVHVC